MKLYNYFRSGTSYRVRIALNFKNIPFTYEAIPLLEDAQHTALYRALNPMGLVPTLVTEDTVLTQSPAILEWIEETYPDPPLLPSDPRERAHVREMAATIACDIHPLNNLRVLHRLRETHDQDEEAVNRWARTWIETGFSAIESTLASEVRGRGFCFGDGPTLADCYLIPQVYSALRFGVDMAAFPLILDIHRQCNELSAFAKAHPDAQPDAPRAALPDVI